MRADHRSAGCAIRSLAAGVALTVCSFAPLPAQAAWCARYQTGASNCGFATHAQCLAAISGMGGSCAQDPRAPATTAEPTPRRAPKEPEKKAVTRSRPAPVAAPAAPTPPAAAPAFAPAASTAATAPAAALPARQAPGDFAAARNLILNGQYEAGLKAMQALGFDDHPEVAAYIGLAHRRLGQVAEARAWYDKALRANPNHALALSFDGMLRAEQGDVGKARDNLEKIRRLCGTDCNEYRALDAVLASAPR
jgi:hypothetical protein